MFFSVHEYNVHRSVTLSAVCEVGWLVSLIVTWYLTSTESVTEPPIDTSSNHLQLKKKMYAAGQPV